MDTMQKMNLDPAIAAYAAGASLKTAGAVMGFCAEGFRKVLKRQGIPIRNIVMGSRRKYTLRHDYFASIDTHEKAWLLGFAAADGLIREEGNWCLLFGLAPKDKEILFRIRKALGSDAPVREGRNSDGSLKVVVEFHSRRLVNDLVRLGIRANKSFTVKPPAIPPELEHSFWLGAFDGDGGFYKMKGCVGRGINFCGNWHMVSAFAGFAQRAAGIRRIPRPHCNIFQLHYNRRAHVVAILSLMYRDSPIWLERKRLLASEELGKTLVPYKFTDLTAEQLLHLHAEHGTWQKVAKAIGASPTNMWTLRRRKGMV